MESSVEFSQLTTNLGDKQATQQVVSLATMPSQKTNTSSLPVSILGT